MSEIKKVLVPDIGDYENVPIIEIMVKVGDSVQAEDPLIVLESDKATVEVPSPYSGTIKQIKLKTGAKVSEGSEILTMEIASAEDNKESHAESERQETKRPEIPADEPVEDDDAEPEEISPQEQGIASSENLTASPPLSRTKKAIEQGADVKPHAGPSVRRFARELGVNLSRVVGTGPKQRILKEDVQAFVKQALSSEGGANVGGTLNLLPWPHIDFAKFGPIERQPLARIRQISGANLHRNWVMIPHVTQFDEADITDLETLRKSRNKMHQDSGIKLTILAFLIKAVTAALKKFPEFNASLEDGSEESQLIIKRYYHIGFAVDTPNGLMVPAIRDADQKGVMEIAEELGRLSLLAREGKLKPTDMQGASFTISSLGGIGGTGFTPIINAPEVAILGVSKASLKPVYRDDEFVPRLMLPLSLSYDHRVIDGASAARFTAHLANILADMRLALF
jgi:pyruvate dehydrogenase E2 component (dihydrolipoamide acetyltransferase)